MEPVRHEVEVAAEPERAFAAFTEDLGSWWPREYTWAQTTLEDIAIEPREGGRCHETGPHGFSCDWGRVLECEPPRKLVFTWQISPDRTPQPDPERASEVEVSFEATDDGTRVAVEHRAFDRHGDEGQGYRDALDTEHGWPYMLDCMRKELA
jgi:uncharacterized protein YndB with AHSA1/START domain